MAKHSLYKIVAQLLSEGNYAISERTLQRRFQKLIAIGGGNAQALKDRNGYIYFEEEEVPFVKHILKQLAENSGLASQFIDKTRGDDYVGAEQVHDFIQDYLDNLANQGVEENELVANMDFLCMLFLVPVHLMREHCHQLIDGIFLNLRAYTYTQQALIMKRLENKLKKEFADILVKSCFMVGELADIIQESKELCGDGIGMQDYGDDEIAMEYQERDRRALEMIRDDPALRMYVEKKVGAKAEEIFNLAVEREDQMNGKEDHAGAGKHP